MNVDSREGWLLGEMGIRDLEPHPDLCYPFSVLSSALMGSLPVPFPRVPSFVSDHVSPFLPTSPGPWNSHGFFMLLSLMRAFPPLSILYVDEVLYSQKLYCSQLEMTLRIANTSNYSYK